MLRGTLYELVRADSLGATVRLLPESAVYRGHFPGYPITPGVCMVQIALELIGEMAGRAGHDGKREMADQVGHDGKREMADQVGHDGKREMADQVGHDGKREMADQVGHDGKREMAGQVGHDGKEVRLVAAKNIKFTSPVFPGDGAELRFDISGEGENRTVEVYNGEVLSAKMSLTVE